MLRHQWAREHCRSRSNP